MKNRKRFIGFPVIIPLLLCILGAASDVRAENIRLPKGTQITLQLNDALSTASNMEGDEFTAVVTTPVSINNRIVIPRGSVVTGSVSRILRPDRLKGKAVLDLMFQSIRVPGREKADIAATLIRVDAGSGGAQPSESFTEREKSQGGATRSGNTESSKVVVRQQSPVGKNPGIGAPGGLPSVFNSQGEDARIPRGASMYVTLDQPLTLTEEIKKPARK